MPIASAAGLFLAKYTLQQTPQQQARMIRVGCTDLDTRAIETILRALAAQHSMLESDVHLVGVEWVHGVLEWVDDDERTQAPAPRGSHTTTAARKSR